MYDKISISEKRQYKVLNTEEAKFLVSEYLSANKFGITVKFGLPEIVDRYHIWKVPLIYKDQSIGEIAVDAYTKKMNEKLSTEFEILYNRIKNIDNNFNKPNKLNRLKNRSVKKEYKISKLKNMILKGNSELVLKELPEESIDMIFTSPPYYNARKEYSEFDSYDDYLRFMKNIIRECHRVLIDGKYFIMNSSHVLVSRNNRNESSQRIAVPFDLHQIFIEEGFEFIDDIIWQKPEGAGWASGRGRRFAADRNAMQYKSVPVTEYVMVYRKKSPLLIDYFIRNHPNPDIVEKSKITGDYEKTNVWYISPVNNKIHPAVFPLELAEKIISYYSFINDIVLDPFGGIGTTAKAAIKLHRRFCLIEIKKKYIEHILNTLSQISLSLSLSLSNMNESDFEYKDLSALVKSEESPVCIPDLMKQLTANGISEQDIITALQNLIANK